jgi:hypothetical protein
MVKKMSKKKSDISFIDPQTMQVRCTFNGCVDKFTLEGFEVKILDNGKEFVSAYHECNQCGQRVKAKGDSKRAYQEWRARQDRALELELHETNKALGLGE